MPDRVQARDARLLKELLNCNIVRCAHYPQAPAFLDACDELGLAVWEETPGWGYVGGEAWRRLWWRDVEAMTVRDRSRPSVVVWGVQPNEARPQAGDAATARARARQADPSRPTSGTSSDYAWDAYVQDVCAYDDYPGARGDGGSWRAVLKDPVPGRPYLVTETIGALVPGFPTYRRIDPQPVQHAQAALHAAVHSAARQPGARYAGVIGWCGIDYPSNHGNVWPGASLKTPGVLDIFRVPKPGAALYRSQAPADRPVIEPAFFWDPGPSPADAFGSPALVFSNCDRIEAFLDGRSLGDLRRRVDLFPHLAAAPFELETGPITSGDTPVLRLDGYIGERLALSCSYDGDTAGDRLLVRADDAAIAADGSDGTRVVLLAVDRFGMLRLCRNGAVHVSLTGPGVLAGGPLIDFAETGGSGAVWVRGVAGRQGEIVVTAAHPTLGSGQATVSAGAVAAPRTASALPPRPVLVPQR